MAELKKVSTAELEPKIKEIFNNQDKEQFGDAMDETEEEIAIGAYVKGELAGGLIAKKKHQKLYVAQLAIAAEHRGEAIGSRLLKEIERMAKEMDVINITLSTRSYQAEGFYKKLGYKVYGILEDMPIEGVTEYYFYKRLK